VLSKHHFSSNGPATVFGKRKIEQHHSELVLSITNWWYVKKHQSTFKPVSVTPKDLHVSIKLSSTVFKSADDTGDLHFDKNGWIVPYPAIIGLLSNSEFSEFWSKVHQKFISETEPESAVISSNNGANDENHDNDNDDNDDDDIEIGCKRVKKTPMPLSDSESEDQESGFVVSASDVEQIGIKITSLKK